MTAKRRLAALAVVALLASPLAGCLGTDIVSPPRSQPGPAFQTLRWHIIGAPHLVRADMCKNGLSEFTTYVPPWGLAIGILTLGIVVPQWTVLQCAAIDK
jgi:hypothetical protein